MVCQTLQDGVWNSTGRFLSTLENQDRLSCRGLINVYSMLKKNGSYEELKAQSRQDNLVFGEDVATIYIEVFNAHRSADKSVVVDKLEECYGKSTDYHSNRMERVTGITGATKVAYRSWFARSRTRVRLPLDAMCKLAIEANVDIMEFFLPKTGEQ